MPRQHPSTPSSAEPIVEVDLNALCANYRLFQGLGNADVAAVVKCNSYGLGLEKTATTLALRENCKVFFVAYPAEGVTLRKALQSVDHDAEIFTLLGPTTLTLPLFKEYQLAPLLNSAQDAQFWAKHGDGLPAGLHFDIGMNRLAAPRSDIDAIRAIDTLNLSLVMAHLSHAGTPHDTHNKNQLDRFKEISALFPNVRKSLSSSGGALINNDYNFDIIRLGVSLYGVPPFGIDDPRIHTVATLKAPIVQIREIDAGDGVGYDSLFVAHKAMQIATVSLGYGDGYPRGASNGAPVMFGNELAPIVGKVSMDLVTIDVSNLKQSAQIGDFATFFGTKPSLTAVAAACGTIPYELLTGLGERIDRRYL